MTSYIAFHNDEYALVQELARKALETAIRFAALVGGRKIEEVRETLESWWHINHHSLVILVRTRINRVCMIVGEDVSYMRL